MLISNIVDIETHWVLILCASLAVLTLLVPLITPWIKITIVLSSLRTGLGLQFTGATLIEGTLALLVSLYVMSPVFEECTASFSAVLTKEYVKELRQRGPMVADRSKIALGIQPILIFLAKNTDENELTHTNKVIGQVYGSDIPKTVLAYVLTQLKEGFLISIKILLPFLIFSAIYMFIHMNVFTKTLKSYHQGTL